VDSKAECIQLKLARVLG